MRGHLAPGRHGPCLVRAPGVFAGNQLMPELLFKPETGPLMGMIILAVGSQRHRIEVGARPHNMDMLAPIFLVHDDGTGLALQWAAVEQAFLAKLADYDVDEEAKETMNEALAAHRQGMFRVAPRLLFPEIERVCSDAFFDGKRTITVPTKNGKQSRLRITRLKEVWEMVREMPLGDLAAYEYSWQLFRKVEDHLYDEVGDDDTMREKYRADPVPNRHGALHGIICYKTQQTSLNTIIMADFIFHLVSQLKKYAVEDTTVDEAG